MAKTDTRALITPGDLLAALGLLSRLPVPVDGQKAAARGAAAAWAYPLAGLAIGAIVAGVASLAFAVGLPMPMAAVLALAASVIVTGAMHEDGLADSADGLWGGWDKGRRLAIMKDSHIGVYGVSALALSFLIRWLALSGFIAIGLHWFAILTAAMLSRAAMVWVMAALPHARTDGLSHTVGRASVLAAVIALVLALMMTLYAWDIAGLLAAAVAAITAILCAAIARAKIGGQTGDILGAVQQMTEMAVLLALIVLISS